MKYEKKLEWLNRNIKKAMNIDDQDQFYRYNDDLYKNLF